MNLIRIGVFETNSSSCHTLVVHPLQKGLKYDTFQAEDMLVLTGGMYGWGYEKLTTPLEKANYVATLLMELKNNRAYKKKENPDNWYKHYNNLIDWAIKNYDECLNNFDSLLIEQTGCLQVLHSISKDYNKDNYSYIDHQSCERISDFQFMLDKKEIKDLIFNKASFIIIDNDN